MNTHGGRLLGSCWERPTCRDYSTGALLLKGWGNAQHFCQASPEVNHLLDWASVQSPVLHIWMSLLLPEKGRTHWCYSMFASCYFLNSSSRCLLQNSYHLIRTSWAWWTFETHTVIATFSLLFSISVGGSSCREHMHLPIEKRINFKIRVSFFLRSWF